MGKSGSAKIDGKQDPLFRPTAKQGKKKKEPLKITYISSPTLVTATNASEFRALVQELTGKNSRVGEEEGGEEDGRYFDNSAGGYHRVPYRVDEIDNYYFEGNNTMPGDGCFPANDGSDVTVATAVMEEGGFSQWGDVYPDPFGDHSYLIH